MAIITSKTIAVCLRMRECYNKKEGVCVVAVFSVMPHRKDGGGGIVRERTLCAEQTVREFCKAGSEITNDDIHIYIC